MAKAPARKKIERKKPKRIARPAKKAPSKPASRSSRGKPVSKAKASLKKTRRPAVIKTGKKTSKPARHATRKKSSPVKAESRKPVLKTAVALPVSPPPRLLPQTKTITAALALMEKGIEYLFQKDFKKARGELKTLLETYPAEKEILARARSYIRICEREEAAQKKPPVTTDQLYALGVLEHNKANYEKAVSYFLKSLENHPDADYIYYSVAASLAMKGDLAGALENLRKAIELNGDSRIYAKNDSDFAALQTKKEFAELVGLSQASLSESL